MQTQTHKPATTTLKQQLAVVVIILVSLYVLAGAAAKLFFGAPSDLPSILLNSMRGNMEGLFVLAISVEIIIGLTALLSPRLGWYALTALITGFLIILTLQLINGEEACGCFGTIISPPPIAMLAVDAVALIAILILKPWQNLVHCNWRFWSLGVSIVALFPALLFLQSEMTVVPGNNPIPVIDTQSTSTNNKNTEENINPVTEARPVIPIVKEWRLPAVFPRFVVLAPNKWIGSEIRRTPLATWTDVSKFPDSTRLIFYYDTCPHCAKHLRKLAQEEPDGSYVMIELPSRPTAQHPVVVDEIPPGLHVKLPRGTRWNIQTPWDVTVVNGKVTEAIYLGK